MNFSPSEKKLVGSITDDRILLSHRLHIEIVSVLNAIEHDIWHYHSSTFSNDCKHLSIGIWAQKRHKYINVLHLVAHTCLVFVYNKSMHCQFALSLALIIKICIVVISFPMVSVVFRLGICARVIIPSNCYLLFLSRISKRKCRSSLTINVNVSLEFERLMS